MAHYDIECLDGSCVESAAIEIRDAWAVFRVEVFEEPPERRRRKEPDPVAVETTDSFIELGRSQTMLVECGDGHYIRISAAHYEHLDPEDCLYGPVERDSVKCVYCGYTFGTADSFNQQITNDPQNHQILRSVTKSPKHRNSVVDVLSSQDCLNHDQVSERNKCPHCGETVFFNFCPIADSPNTNFVEIGSDF